MREYGIVQTDFWINPQYAGLSSCAKLIAIYLLSSPHTTMLGCFRLPVDYIAVDLNLGKTVIQDSLHELIHLHFLSVDFKNHWIVIHPFLEWNPIENPNQAKHILKLFDKVPECISVYPELIKILQTHKKQLDEEFLSRLETLSKGFENCFETVSKPFRNQKQKQKQDQEQEQKQDQEQEQNIICATPCEEKLVSETILEIPLNTGKPFQVTAKQVDAWKALYPSVDILQELRNIVGWNDANPTRRKTKNGILKHINYWLSRVQNQPSSQYSSRSPPRSNSLYERNCETAAQWLNASQNKNNLAGEKVENFEKSENVFEGEIIRDPV